MATHKRELLDKLQKNIEKVFKGKPEVIKNSIIAMLAQGHLLIEDVPGVGKTTLARLLARSLSCSFQRIQFTSDLLPSDILGVTIYDAERKEFEFRRGPVFANIILADEINRTTPKTQSALLEAMNTNKVSIDKMTYDLPEPFMVIATQNPVEFYGTFPLPRAQLDRFLMRINVGYPDLSDEITILREQKTLGNVEKINAVLTIEDVVGMQKDVENVRIDNELLRYISQIASATRKSADVELGVSPRGSIALRRVAQARAYYENRDYCIPDDIKSMIIPVLAHRIQITKSFETGGIGASRENEETLRRIISQIEIPL